MIGNQNYTSLKWVVGSLAMISASLERIEFNFSICWISTALERTTMPSRWRALSALPTFSGVMVCVVRS